MREAAREDGPLIATAVSMAVGYDTSHPISPVFLALAEREVSQYSYRNALIGEVVAYVASLIAMAKFNLFGIVQGVAGDNATMICCAVVMAIALVVMYVRQLKRSLAATQGSIRKSATESASLLFMTNRLYGVLIVMFLLSVMLLIIIGENLMFFISLSAATLALLLMRITTLRGWYVVAIALVLLHTLSFLYALAMALTIGAYGAVLMLAYLDFRIMLSLGHLYILERTKKYNNLSVLEKGKSKGFPFFVLYQ